MGYAPLLKKFFIENIQKIKKVLRIICYAPHPSAFADTFPPRGRLDIRQR